jgi:hypothetical protein
MILRRCRLLIITIEVAGAREKSWLLGKKKNANVYKKDAEMRRRLISLLQFDHCPDLPP